MFRREVFAARENRHEGKILILRPLSYTFYCTLAGFTLLGVGALLFLASYTKKTRLAGMLVPSGGVIRVVAPTAGVVTSLFTSEGSSVVKGTRLLILSAGIDTEAAGPLHHAVGEMLATRRNALESEAANAAQIARQQQESLNTRLQSLAEEARQLQREIELQSQRVDSAEQQFTRHRDLHAKQFLSDLQLQQRHDEVLDQQARLQSLLRAKSALERDMSSLHTELRALPLSARRDESSTKRGVNSLRQEGLENEARGVRLVVAPSGGRVSTLQANVGTSFAPGQSLLQIVPSDSKLEAQLYATSKSIGFLNVGQRVLLRYQAFPYQKFGQYPGVISSVSRAPIGGSDLPSGLPGVSNSLEGMFRVSVNLDDQSVRGFGELRPLQPGMLVEADVIEDRRTLIEWAFEPLLSLRGRFE